MISSLLLVFGSLLMCWQAALIRPDSSFEKNIPGEHPWMQVLHQYQADFGGANTLLIALLRHDGQDIYEAGFLRQLEAATTEVTFIPGIDRTRVSSLFTRNVMFLEVDEEGFAGDNVVPPEWTPSAETLALIRGNVGKAGLIGRLVSLDQHGAMIATEVLDRDPVSGLPIDLVALSARLEDQIRRRFESPTRWQLRARTDQPPFRAGEIVAERFTDPGWRRWFGRFEAARIMEDGRREVVQIPAAELEFIAGPNPQYQPQVSVHMIGFAPVVGAVAGATAEVLGFFLITVAATMLALIWYLGSLRLALLPMLCSVAAVVWEFGLLRLAGLGLDPFAILVPFLVLAVSTSHGVQYVNRWADEVCAGRGGQEASVAVFRRLFIPGTIALITNIAGFLTILLIPVASVQELAVHASLGMVAVLVTNKLLMPVLLSVLRLRDPQAFHRRRLVRQAQSEPLWRWLAQVTRPAVAGALLALAVAVFAGCLWLSQGRIVGDAQAGVPELRPDSRYNRDVAAINRNFAIGTDVMKIIAETDPEACIRYTPLEQVDRFAWEIANTPGVSSTLTAVDLAKTIYAAMSEGNPKFHVLPRNRYALVLATTPIETSSGLLDYECTAMPVIVFAEDHRASTIARIADAARHYNARNAAEFYAAQPDADPALCAQKQALRRELGRREHAARRHYDALLAGGLSPTLARAHPDMERLNADTEASSEALAAIDTPCPVNFALATGNLGVMGATNEVVAAAEWPMLAWVYAVILVLLLLSYRSLSGWLVIGLPLFAVSVFANALMAVLGIGLKVATLPVVTLAVGLGVDYGIYVYDVLHTRLRDPSVSLHEAYLQTLRETGKAVIFTGLCLAGGVIAWLFSELQFQRDMGLLLVFMFSANMLGAILLLPALCRLLPDRLVRN